MAKKRPDPALTHTGLLCLAYRALEQDVRNWETSLANLPAEERRLEKICETQLRQMEAIRQMYLIETGTNMYD